MISRLEFLGAVAAAAGLRQDIRSRFTLRPARAGARLGAGAHSLGLGRDRDALLVVPATAGNDPLPLVIALHGAGGAGRGPVRLLGPFAEELRFLLLAPDSRDATWDAILGGYGDDVAFIERAVQWTLERCRVDRSRIYLEGFSDGASYALGLGLANGDVFSKIAAYSPGFIPEPGAFHGAPAVFISHGTADAILPIDRTSRRIVPILRRRALHVTYVEFEGGHAVTPEIARRGMEFLLG